MSISKSEAVEIYRLTKQNASKIKQVKNSNIHLLVKLANNVSEEDFIEMVISGEIPAIRLSNAEMEMLKGGAEGGWIPKWVVEAWNEFKSAVGLN